MSHAVVLVNVGQAVLQDVEGIVSELMAPYNENIEVPRYRDYLSKQHKASEILSVSKDWEKHKATLDRRFIEPVSPRNQDIDIQSNPQEEWLALWNKYDKEVEAIADLYTDEEVAAAYNAYWTKEDTGGDRFYVGEAPDAEHSSIYRWSTYNPQSKWDWWQIGGRWSGTLQLKGRGWYIVNTTGWDATWWSGDGWVDDTAMARRYNDGEKAMMSMDMPEHGEWMPAGANVALARDIDWERMEAPFAYLDEERGWMENGKLGWFGLSSDEKHSKDEWERQFHEWAKQLPEDAVIATVDYHI